MAGLCEGDNEPPGSLKATYSLKDKLDILKRLDEGETVSGIPRSTIHDWKRNRAALEEYCASTSSNDKRRALKQFTYLQMAFKEPQGSLPPSHKPAIGPYPVQD
ncbi:hypothetical protein ANN_24021 [Periplaneta americana]|uniref:Uncharacterized protein n=1 Tax=Periplaneta americana TaxID=6978 RepID=A0ABQ8S1Z5_PERAM|nr:hypothetical protein ANN_24021 [Periplaneta americana]